MHVAKRTAAARRPSVRASEKGHTETAALLVERGADVNAANSKGLTALMRASYGGYGDGGAAGGARRGCQCSRQRRLDAPHVGERQRSHGDGGAAGGARRGCQCSRQRRLDASCGRAGQAGDGGAAARHRLLLFCPPTAPSPAPPPPPVAPAPATSPPPPPPSAALAEALRGGSRPWNYAKLMLVGEGRAGKTSMMRALLGQTFDAHEASTNLASTQVCSVERTVASAATSTSGGSGGWHALDLGLLGLQDEHVKAIARVLSKVSISPEERALLDDPSVGAALGEAIERRIAKGAAIEVAVKESLREALDQRKLATEKKKPSHEGSKAPAPSNKGEEANKPGPKKPAPPSSGPSAPAATKPPKADSSAANAPAGVRD